MQYFILQSQAYLYRLQLLRQNKQISEKEKIPKILIKPLFLCLQKHFSILLLVLPIISYIFVTKIFSYHSNPQIVEKNYNLRT